MLAIPSLTGIQYGYRMVSNPGPLAELAAQAVDAGLGSSDLWKATGDSPSGFLELSLAQHLEDQKVGNFEPCIDLSMGISKVYEDTDQQYSLWLGVSACCCLTVGEQINQLEKIDPSVAISWYKVLLTSLSLAGYVFDAKNAYWQFEGMVENASMEAEEGAEYNNELDQFNPDLDIPRSLLDVVKNSWTRRSVNADVLALEKYREGTLSSIIDPVLEMWRISQQRGFRNLRQMSEDEDDSTQIPFCLVNFREHDSIHAAFDEFGQFAYENNCDDILWARTLDINRPKAFQKAIPSLDLYLRFLHAMTALRAVIDTPSPE